MSLQNLFTILTIFIFFPFHTNIYCKYSKMSLNSQLKDDNFMHCKFGKFNRFDLFCDCSKVIGNGPKCEIEKTFNNTDLQVIFLCVQDASQTWKKNIEIQFPGESITTFEENENYVKGFINKSLLSFEIHYFCEKSAKNIFWWPRLLKTEEIVILQKVITNDFVKIKKNQINVEDISPKCNFGIHKRSGPFMLPQCDCTNVFGNETYCEITLNRTSHYTCLLCLIEKSEAWKMNLETQFSKRSINIIEEGEKFVKGSIENHISFEVFYFCERYAKNIFLWPQQSKQSSKNNSSYFGKRNVTNVPNILNETRTVKVSDNYVSNNKLIVVIFPMVFVIMIILSTILYRYRKEIKEKYNRSLGPTKTQSNLPLIPETRSNLALIPETQTNNPLITSPESCSNPNESNCV